MRAGMMELSAPTIAAGPSVLSRGAHMVVSHARRSLLVAPKAARTAALRCSADVGRADVGRADVSGVDVKTASEVNGSKRAAPPKPVYVTTPSSDRATRSPHSGYHFDGSGRRFFEGWYFKVSIPEAQESFAWMYSVEDPGSGKRRNELQNFVGGPRFPGIGAQVMAGDEYLFQYDQDVETFWGYKHELCLGHTFKAKTGKLPPPSEVRPAEFWDRVDLGFQVTPTWHQGCVQDNGRTSYAKTVDTIRWEYSTQPVYGWGSVGEAQKPTAGWLAAFRFFEPHWQVCMAHGLSTGWIECGDKRFEFENAPSYSEKNWGGAFPQKWFWVQCNVFEGVSGELALTAAGGRRGLPLLAGTTEDVAMLGVHYDGKFHEFVPWVETIEWDIEPWGSWKISGSNQYYKVKLEATTDDPGVVLRAPTPSTGLAPFCRDTFEGKLRLQMWELSVNGADKIIVDATSTMAALEVGGAPWYEKWQHQSRVQEPLRTLVGLPVNVEQVYSRVPVLKPPGL